MALLPRDEPRTYGPDRMPPDPTAFAPGGPVRAPRRMTTYGMVLGPMARPLSEVVANWRVVGGWRRRLILLAWPSLAHALDDLSEGLENVLGPL